MARSRMSGLFDFFSKKKKSLPGLPAPKVDLYKAIGVTPGASQSDIRAAFRELSAKFHPDRNPGDATAAAKYQEIIEAYSVLSDPSKRAAYDKSRSGKSQEKGLILFPEAEMMFEADPFMEMPSKREEEKKKKEAPKGFRFEDAGIEIPEPVPIIERSRPARREELFEEDIYAPQSEEAAVEDIRHVVQSWPLDFIWDTARSERGSAGFREAGALWVESIAGTGGQPIEEEIAEAFAIPFSTLQDFKRQYGAEALHSKVFRPIFNVAQEILNQIKPQDIPGAFYIDFSRDGRTVDLLYAEATGRRPWK